MKKNTSIFSPISVTRLSVTEISLGMRCPAQLWFKLAVGPRPPKAAAVTGIAFHKGVEVALKDKVKSGRIEPEPARDAFVESFRIEALDADFEGENPDVWEKTGLEALDVYLRRVCPTFEPDKEDDIEQHFEIQTRSGLVISGIIDLIDGDGTLIDHKTTNRNPKQGANGLQYIAYQLPLKEIRPFKYSVIALSTRKTEMFEKQTSLEQVRSFVEAAEHLAANLRLGNIVPNPMNVLCSERWCGWWNLCPFGGRIRR